MLFREGSGALHHGNEPLLHFGAGVPHDLPPPHAQTGFAGADPEESHLPQQEFPGSAAGSGPPADQEEENVPDPVIRRPPPLCSEVSGAAWCRSGNLLQYMMFMSAET